MVRHGAPAHRHTPCRAQAHERRVPRGVGREERHIARGGVVLLVVEAVGVCKRAARHADALRRLVHPADEARDAPAAVVGQRDGRVVSRAEQQPVEQRLHGERLTGL